MADEIHLTDDQLRVLRVVAKSEGRTVEDIVRLAVTSYLEARRGEKQKVIEDSFGLWGEGEDGLAYQERLRSEW